MITMRNVVRTALLAVEAGAVAYLVNVHGWWAFGAALVLALAHGVEQRHFR